MNGEGLNTIGIIITFLSMCVGPILNSIFTIMVPNDLGNKKYSIIFLLFSIALAILFCSRMPLYYIIFIPLIIWQVLFLIFPEKFHFIVVINFFKNNKDIYYFFNKNKIIIRNTLLIILFICFAWYLANPRWVSFDSNNKNNKTCVLFDQIPKDATIIPENYFKYNLLINPPKIPNTVTCIGKGAFRGCKFLFPLRFFNINNKKFKTIDIPSSVEIIEDSAFENCSIEIINFSENEKLELKNNVFTDCEHLYCLNFPNSLEKTGKEICLGCTSLKSVKLPENPKFTSIESAFFSRCTNLSQINIPKYVDTISVYAFNGCKNLLKINKNNIKTIETSAFENSGITNINLQNVIVIFPHAFEECEYLDKVVMPNLESIGDYAFKNCKKLNEITLSNKLETIGSYAFENCGFKDFTIKKNLNRLDEYAFLNCPNLEKFICDNNNNLICENNVLLNHDKNKIIAFPSNYVYNNKKNYIIPKEIDTINPGAFSFLNKDVTVDLFDKNNEKEKNKNFLFFGNVLYSKDLSKIILSFRNESSFVLFEKKVEEISSNAFRGNNDLISLDLENSNLTKISKYAFADCFNVNDIKLPDTLNVIDDYAFLNCKNLEKITLPDSIKTIPNNCFNGCENLHDVELPNSLEIINNGAFINTKINTIILPKNLKIINKYAFQNCKLLKKIRLPKNLEYINKYAFKGCDNLKVIEYSKNLDISKLNKEVNSNRNWYNKVKFKKYDWYELE